MASLTVHDLDEGLVRKLRLRAAEHGRSAEAEHREILRQVLDGTVAPPDRTDIARRLAAFQEEAGVNEGGSTVDLLAAARRERMRRLTGSDEGF